MSQGSRRVDTGVANRVPDELLDAFFDGELDDAGKSRLFDGLREDPTAAERFARTMFAMEQLRRRPGADAPDFAGTVLAEVDRRRRWLTPRARRVVQLGRYGAAAAILLMLGGGFVFKRANPDSALLADRPAPLTSVVESSRFEAREGIRNMASAFAPFRSAVADLGQSRTLGATAAVNVAHRTEVHMVRFVAPTELPAEMPWCSRHRSSGLDATQAVWTLERSPASANGAVWAKPASTGVATTPARVIVIPGG